MESFGILVPSTHAPIFLIFSAWLYTIVIIIILLYPNTCTAGLGFDAARQLALLPDNQRPQRIILACRNPTKAEAAKTELQALTQQTDDLFEILILDVSNLESCRKAAETLQGTVDGLVLVCLFVERR